MPGEGSSNATVRGRPAIGADWTLVASVERPKKYFFGVPWKVVQALNADSVTFD
jgi:hypothetical protein